METILDLTCSCVLVLQNRSTHLETLLQIHQSVPFSVSRQITVFSAVITFQFASRQEIIYRFQKTKVSDISTCL